MHRIRASFFLFCAICLFCPFQVGAAVRIDFVPVGNRGNASDSSSGVGAVADVYRIGTYEVTNAQYAAFLNTVDSTGGNVLSLYNSNMSSSGRGGIVQNPGGALGSRYELKPNMGHKPVIFVSFLDSMRFANWLHNGQGPGSTEVGAYTLADGGLAARNPGATVWIPSNDEWYKAAYYDPVSGGADANGTADYWLYPTQSDTLPTQAAATASGDISNPGTNVANYGMGADWNGQNGNVTTVGDAGSASHYGTFDQGGNVWEWNEGISGSSRLLRAGGYFDAGNRMQPLEYTGGLPGSEFFDVGFRVATLVPEPGTIALAALGLAAGLLSRRCSHRQGVR